MDRFSIIQQQVFNRTVVDETSSCDLDQCICDEPVKKEEQSLKKNRSVSGCAHHNSSLYSRFNNESKYDK